MRTDNATDGPTGARGPATVRFHDGDRGAFDEVYRDHAGRMFGAAYMILKDHGLAADAVQNAFLKAWQATAGYDPARPLGAWLHAIVRNAAFDLRRQPGRVRDIPVGNEDLDARRAAARGSEPDLEPVWVGTEVRAALIRLPRAERDILARCYYYGRSLDEIADELGVPVGTVKSRLSRALRKLATPLAHLASAA